MSLILYFILYWVFFLGTGGSATIKHRCVTHLYGKNFSEQLTVGSGQ